MKNLILIITLIFASTQIGKSQTNTQNYVATHKFRVETTNLDPWLQNKENVLTSIQYVDGLGRPIELVSKQGSADGKDIIVPVVYDVFGREVTKYLPYTQNSTNGGFVSISTAISNQTTFYNDAALLGLDESTAATTKLTYEASPRNLVVQELGPGKDWQVTNIKPIKIEYLTNIDGTASGQEQIIAWTINASGSPVRRVPVEGFILTGGYYATGQLSVKSSLDENGNISREYVDKSGRMILKKIYEVGDSQALNNRTNWNQTYYIYDDLGNLRFVFQPILSHNLSSNTTNVPSSTNLATLAFEYKYDSRNRMIAKRVPGGGWVEMVYDPFDRVVLVRDGNDQGTSVTTALQLSAYDGKDYQIQGSGSVTLLSGYQFAASPTSTLVIGPNPVASKWTFTKYDHLNRPILTGTYFHTGSRNTVQNFVNSFYANVSNPRFDSYNSSGPIEKYTNNSFPKQHQSGTAISSQDLLSVNYYDNYGFTSLTAPVGADVAKAKGQLTGTKTKVLGSNNFLTAVTWYDDKYRVLKSHSENHLNGNDQITLEYFNKIRGEVKKQTHTNLSNGVTNTVVEEFQYNHLGQIISATHKLNGNTVESINAITFDKFGRMSANSIGNGLQNVDYRYNIRGWLSSINGGATTFNDTHDVFGMDLRYQNATTGFQQFNGNIGQIFWKNTGGVGVNQNVQEYRFTYDKLNRLKDADYLSSGINGHFNEKGISYDKNGNILALQRTNSNTLIDNLTYTFSGNQLTKVTDAAANVMGFADGANLTTEYTYDPVGNMTSDKNKKVTVSYNHLNLPDQVIKENGDYVKFTYDAAGIKRKSETKTGALVETRDYVGNFVFANGQLEHIIHPEGRVVFEAGIPKYEYFLKDHLGNVRQVVRGTGTVARIATMESDNQEEESKHFEMLQSSRQTDQRHNVTEGGEDIAWLNASRGRILGPTTSIEVAEGDSIHLSVFAKYERKRRRFSKASVLPPGAADKLVSDIGTMTMSGGANPITLLQIADLIASDLQKKETPEAYMGYALYDSDSNLYEKGKILLSSQAENKHEKLNHAFLIEKGGFMETFLVNETSQDVFFDNFRILSTPSTTVQVTHYYPFGGTFGTFNTGIENRYQFQGMEMQKEVETYIADFRTYDPWLGRWGQIDPKANEFHSPYMGMGNNPLSYIDPRGDTIIVNRTGYVTRNDKTDNLVFTSNKNGKLIELGQLGGEINVDEIYSNLLEENTEKSSEILNPFEFRELVTDGGDWDLKNDKNSIFGLGNDGETVFSFNGEKMESQDIGNHHFGAVALANPIISVLLGEEGILKQAGLNQMSKPGMSKPEWQVYKEKTRNSFSPSGQVRTHTERVMQPPYGDDPRDQKFIKKGFEFFKKAK